MSITTKTVKCYPFLLGETIYQNQVFTTISEREGSKSTENQSVLVPNIWEDLKKPSGGLYKNVGNYFYWEANVTNKEGVEEVIMFPAPDPMKEDVDPDMNWEVNSGDSPWTAYWRAHYKAVEERQEDIYCICPKKIILEEVSLYVPKATGPERVTLPKRVINQPFGTPDPKYLLNDY